MLHDTAHSTGTSMWYALTESHRPCTALIQLCHSTRAAHPSIAAPQTHLIFPMTPVRAELVTPAARLMPAMLRELMALTISISSLPADLCASRDLVSRPPTSLPAASWAAWAELTARRLLALTTAAAGRQQQACRQQQSIVSEERLTASDSTSDAWGQGTAAVLQQLGQCLYELG